VQANRVLFSQRVLAECKILVIANALDASDTTDWIVPDPSAFSGEEVGEIKKWVAAGGCLLLIADHMPFAGAAAELAKAFGFEFINGFEMSQKMTWPPSVFTRKDGTLKKSPLIDGESESLDSIASFTGQAFRIPSAAQGVLEFDDSHDVFMPDTAWVFNDRTPKISAAKLSQGAIMKFEKGRVAIFGEAAMFTAQLAGPNRGKMGMNSSRAKRNPQFVLNVIHWLDGILD